VGWLAFAKPASDSIPLRSLNYAPGRLLVKLKSIPERMQEELIRRKSVSRTHIASIDKLNRNYGVYAIERLFENAQEPQPLGDRVLDGDCEINRLFVFKTSLTAAILELAAEYSQNPLVEYAEPDYIGQGGGAVIPNDTRFAEQWALHNVGQTGGKEDADIDAVEAWEFTNGDKEVIIAVLDTGIDLQHPDLKSKIVAGFDFVNSDDDAQDDHGHGTSNAGIIGAVTDNHEGIAGVCQDCTLLPVKVLSAANFGFYSWWAKGIRFAVEQHAHVIAMSLGGNVFSQSLKDAVDFAYNNGVVLVSISHNFGNDALYYPGGFENVIAVGATDMNDKRWANSNFGSHLDVVAPGKSILTTKKAGAYSRWTGTSQAAAHVAGLAALLLSLKPELTPAQVREIIEQTAEDKVGLAAEDTPGWDMYYGHGRINAYQALALAAGISVVATQPQQLATTTWGRIKSSR